MKSFSTTIKSSTIASHSVLRNTYALLGSSVIVSAICATLSVIFRLPSPGTFLTIIGYYGLLYAIQMHAYSAMGILFVFMLTGFMGYTLGPILNMLLSTNMGTSILISSLMGTGVSFISLSVYALTTKKDFSFLQGFLFTCLIGCLIASGIGLIFNMPIMGLLVASAMTAISSGLILFHTSEIIHGGERNYILATVSLFVALYNLFISIIQILMAFSNNRRD